MEARIDKLDRALLRRLAADGRLTMAKLGRRVGLSRTAVLA
jgi:Lrp/AsnC family leucine-responsive transcriptional regulator